MGQPEQLKKAVTSPVENDEPEHLEPGVALCLSGGGYRAMLFHVGAIWRLNELRYLPKLDRVSSVSGGSITAGALGMNWHKLQFDDDGFAGNLDEQFVKPIRHIASKTIDLGAVVGGILLPGTISDRVAGAYRKHIFGHKTLQDLPDKPRFVLNATNIQTGSLWRFSKPYMADYQVGVVRNPKVDLAVAVAASSAFPPILSPVELDLDSASFDPAERGPLHVAPYTTDVVLADGGVYDNLGLETAWKRYRTILVSDGGGHFSPKSRIRTNWPLQAQRVLGVIDGQVRSLRKRQVIGGLKANLREGAYWSIWSETDNFELQDPLDCPDDATKKLAAVPTRLRKTDSLIQRRLINWGYAICDTAMRTHVLPGAPSPPGFPYPEAGV